MVSLVTAPSQNNPAAFKAKDPVLPRNRARPLPTEDQGFFSHLLSRAYELLPPFSPPTYSHVSTPSSVQKIQFKVESPFEEMLKRRGQSFTTRLPSRSRYALWDSDLLEKIRRGEQFHRAVSTISKKELSLDTSTRYTKLYQQAWLLSHTVRTVAHRFSLTPPLPGAGAFLTMTSEGTPEQTNHTHWPGGASGVTLGYGYDMSKRSRKAIFSDLVSAGVTASDARIFAQGSGLVGTAAKKFAADHASMRLTQKQQYLLYERVYPHYIARAQNVLTRMESAADWKRLPLPIQALVVDFCYRGDCLSDLQQALFTNLTCRERVSAALKAIQSMDTVPEDRRNRRVAFLESSLLIDKSFPSFFK